MARGPDMPPGAAVLENFFPTATGVVLRRGSQRWATLNTETQVSSLFTYTAGGQRELFAANSGGVWNVTSVSSPYSYALSTETPDYIAADVPGELVLGESSVGIPVLGGTTSGDWVVIQYTTAGGSFLVGVNGSDAGFLYDGATFSATAITFPAPYAALTTADLAYVWVYKQRIWFIQKNSMNAWYLPVDQVGGALTLWPMGGIFVTGGALLWGQSWSLDSGGAGGLSEQCVFATTEGEVAAYQGLSPDVDQGWSKVGVYRIGKPLGKKAMIRAGGDLVIATSVGFISLAAAARQDYAALGQNAVSYPIEDDWARAVQERGQDDWRCQVWADGQMALVSPPTPVGRLPVVFASNVNTGKWCKFSGWDARSLEVFDGGILFGTSAGTILRGWVGGSDEVAPYVGRILPLFDNLDAPAAIKVAKMARAITRSALPATVKLSGQVNFKVNFPPAPSIASVPVGNEWDNAIWGIAVWDAERGETISGDWVSVGGSGHDIAIGAQITSGGAVPIDLELIRIDLTYAFGDIGT